MTPRIVVALKTVGNDVVQTRRFRVRRTIATVRACVDRLAPWQVDELKTRILVESRFAGVQITDTDKVELVEGSAAGWAATN